jgi:ribosomal protein S27E
MRTRARPQALVMRRGSWYRGPDADPGGLGAGDYKPDALTGPAGVSYDSMFEGVETKGLSVDEEALIAWQDVLDMVVNGRPNEVACPYCNHRPLTIEEVDQSTRISCSKCGKFIQGRFTH